VLVRKPQKTAWLNVAVRPQRFDGSARLTGCGATVIPCGGAGLPTEGSVQEGFADHEEKSALKSVGWSTLRPWSWAGERPADLVLYADGSK